MDRKICDGCGKEINGHFTKVTIKRMIYDGDIEMLGPTLMGKHTIGEYDLCDKYTPAMILTKQFRGCEVFKINKIKGVEL